MHIRELFTTPPEQERDYFRDSREQGGVLGKVLLVVDRLAAMIDPLHPEAHAGAGHAARRDNGCSSG